MLYFMLIVEVAVCIILVVEVQPDGNSALNCA